MHRARTCKSHHIHPEHHHTLLTGFAASSCSCSSAARGKPGVTAAHPEPVLGLPSVCWGTCLETPESHTAASLQCTEDFPSPSSCILTPNFKVALVTAEVSLSKVTTFCHSSLLPGGVSFPACRDINLAHFPQEQHGFRQELVPGIQAQDRQSRVPAVPLPAASPFTAAALG